MQIMLYDLKYLHRTSKGKRVTWKQVADETGICERTLYSLARGTIRSLRPEYVDALCKYFDCSVGTLIRPDDIELPARWAFRQ